MPPHDLPPAPRESGPPDLTDAELDELAELLAAPPPGVEPMGVSMLDGYLAGVLVQPVAPSEPEWLAEVFHPLAAGPQPLPPDSPWRRRVEALVRRRSAVLARGLHEDGWFEPLIFAFDDEHPIAVSEYEPLARLPPVSQAIAPWAAGLWHAMERFPALEHLQNDEVDARIAAVLRHLPGDPDEATDAAAEPPAYDPADPMAGYDDAVDELILAVLDIADRTRDARFRVETVRRDTPKVGRNDPCPCGSGRKFKHCHGKG